MVATPDPYRSPWLSPDEVAELTAFKTWKRQCLALAQMGIPFRPNRVGRPLVERAAVLPEETKASRRAGQPTVQSVEWVSNRVREMQEAKRSAASERASKAGRASARARRKGE